MYALRKKNTNKCRGIGDTRTEAEQGKTGANPALETAVSVEGSIKRREPVIGKLRRRYCTQETTINASQKTYERMLNAFSQDKWGKAACVGKKAAVISKNVLRSPLFLALEVCETPIAYHKNR